MFKLFSLTLFIKGRPDFLLVSSPSLHATIGGRFLKWFYSKTRLILEVRDIWPFTLQEVGGLSKKHPFIRWMLRIERRAYYSADYIISTLPFAHLRVKEVLGTTEFRYKYIPQGIALNNESTSSVFSDKYNRLFADSNFIIGYAGTIGASNALETLISTANELWDEGHLDIHFMIVGDGPMLEELKSMTKERPNVLFIPKVPNVDLPSLLDKCDILYDSTKRSRLYKYGLSRNKWIDYMLVSKPLLVSYSGRENIIRNTMCGFVVESENVVDLKKAILELKMSPTETLKLMGARGYEYAVKNRNFDDLTNDLVNVFEILK